MTIPTYDPKLIHPLFPRFCPCGDCPYYLDLNNYITKDGTYPVQKGTERRQRLYCHAGKHRFSEMAYSPLFGHHGNFKEYTQTAKMTTYGLSSDQIADILDRDSRTVLQWQKALGNKSQSFHLALCTLMGLTLTFIQMDEIWSYLNKKKRQLWVFITLEAQTKFWVNFELGSRNGHTANRLLDNLVFLMQKEFNHLLLVTTDKLAAYEKAIAMNLFDYNYCQFHKSLRQDLTGVSTKFQPRYKHLTPAMKMGLTSTRLEWRDLIVAPLAEGAASLTAEKAH